MPASDASAFQLLLKGVIEELYADRIFVAHVVSDAVAFRAQLLRASRLIHYLLKTDTSSLGYISFSFG